MSRTPYLWQTVNTATGGRAERIILDGLAEGLTFDRIARRFEDHGAYVSREWVRQQAKRIQAERAA